MHHTHYLSNSWERERGSVCCIRPAVLQQHTLIWRKITPAYDFLTVCHTSSSFSFSRLLLLSLISYCTACPLWLRHLSLSAVAESLSNVCCRCPARANPRRELEDTCKHIHHIESRSSSSGLAARRWHCLFRGEHKQIDWAAILQLLMLTHPVHYQRGRDLGPLIKWSRLSVSAPHLLPLLHPFQGYPAGGGGMEGQRRWQPTWSSFTKQPWTTRALQ